MSAAARPLTDRRGRVYKPAIGRRLKLLLGGILGGVALLGANSVYLASITALEWLKGHAYQTPFYYLMFALHLALGIGLIVPFLAFAFTHLVTSWNRPNKAAIRYGVMLLVASLIVLVTGLILVRLGGFEVKDPAVRRVGYWLHVVVPVAAIWLYLRHRMTGPRIKWRWVRAYAGCVAAFVAAMGLLHSQDPRDYGAQGPREGRRYFFPSEATTRTGNFIPAKTLMMDNYCLECHQDSYKGWSHSAHRNSSFNNPAYLASVRETRQVSLKRDGDLRGARWCAGCHDPVPFFSGEFDDPKYDDVKNPTSQAGITCTSCHAITHVNSTRGNGDYTIEEPQHYPFAASDSPILRWVNRTLVKAKPEMHKKTFLKPLHKTAEFCSTCHKVGLPWALNHYKDFVRGQNHYDTYLLSGVSGGGARSFYYPPPDQKAKGNCAECHMNFIASNDFGARDFDGKPGREIHDHLFLGANTGLPTLKGDTATAEAHAKFLRDKKVRVDLFALRKGGAIDGELLGPLRPAAPTLTPGEPYLVEAVVRTLGLGHPFSQGTVDSNEIWVELIARAAGRVVGRSGGIGPDGTVDPYSHFINVYMLDRDGNRIDRRNPQDIFVPLYNKQVPPGAGQVVHFGLDVPRDIKGPITLEAKVNYRKFDRKYMDFVVGPGKGPELPVVVMATDSVTLAVAGGPAASNPPSPIAAGWQRWNDYGIGLFLEGTDKGGAKGELKQAEPVFQKVADLGFADGWVNLARVYQREGRIPEALQALERAAKHPNPAAPWVIAWLTGQIDERNGYLDEAIERFEAVLATKIPARGFDFSRDYEVINALGNASWGRSRQEPPGSAGRLAWLEKVVAAYRRTLAVDSENVAAHYGLGIAYAELARGSTAPEPAPAAPPAKGDAAAESLIAQTGAAAAPGGTPAGRLAAARRLAAAMAAFLAGPRPAFGSRTEPLHDLVDRLGAARLTEADPAARAEQARTLAAAHKALHAMFKPDETAEGRVAAIARRNSRAADLNAQSIVIHPLNRPGAPGVEPGPVAVREIHP